MDSLGHNPAEVFFAIRLEPNGSPIGLISLREIHLVHRAAELFVRIGSEDARGKGYGTSARRSTLLLATSILSEYIFTFSPRMPLRYASTKKLVW
jgi:RimJ/RimL family protein N-acetyltransferase